MSIVYSTPAVLKWAREQSGFDLKEVAKKLKRSTVTAQTITEWENGTAFPSYSQLESLAYKIYKRPLAVFFFPTPPDESDIKQSFRTLPDSIESLSPRMRIILRKARSMQLNVMELSQGEKSKKAIKNIFEDIRFTTTPSINILVKKVRKYLGINVEEQKSWSQQSNAWDSFDTALKKWRNAIQSHGVFVFKDSFKDTNFSGFCLYDNNFPIIYMNNSESKARQIFTLFHELAHILFHTSGFDPLNENHFKNQLQGNNKKIETMCNEFAGAFLVPEESLPQNIEIQDIKKWAASYSVSQEVFLIRLLKNKRISATTYNKAKTKILKEYQSFRQKPKTSSGGGNYYATKEAYLGDKYISLAFKKYYQKHISLVQLADFLDVKPKVITHIDPFKQRGVFE